MVLFEPPLQFEALNTGLDVRGIGRYEEKMAVGDVCGALVEAMWVVKLGPQSLPYFLIKALAKLILWWQKGTKGGMADMAPLLRYDFAIAEGMIGNSERFRGVSRERKVLLLGGEASPAYLEAGLNELERVVESVERKVLKGVGHGVLCNRSFRGCPEKALESLREFLDWVVCLVFCVL